MYEILLENVNFNYGTQVVLDDVSFLAEAGDFICVIGPSGCGKSTLLRLIAGLDYPRSGTVSVGGKNVTGPGLDRGMVFQDYSLFPWMTSGQNIMFALEQAYPGKTRREIRSVAEDYLELVGLDNAFYKLPKELSGGMRQRAAIARVFAVDSPVLLMDEPFGALDAITRAHLQELLLQLWHRNGKERKTVFFVTHEVDEALLLANKVVVLGLNPGRVKEVVSIDIPRPRLRQQLYADEIFQSFRERLLGFLNEDILFGLNQGQWINSQGDSI